MIMTQPTGQNHIFTIPRASVVIQGQQKQRERFRWHFRYVTKIGTRFQAVSSKFQWVSSHRHQPLTINGHLCKMCKGLNIEPLSHICFWTSNHLQQKFEDSEQHRIIAADDIPSRSGRIFDVQPGACGRSSRFFGKAHLTCQGGKRGETWKSVCFWKRWLREYQKHNLAAPARQDEPTKVAIPKQELLSVT